MDYRKKPIVVDAIEYKREENIHAVMDFFGDGNGRDLLYDVDKNEYFIRTLEGDMYLTPGDWIIKGIKGEFYPCKPDIFEATYEPAGDVKVELRPLVVDLTSGLEGDRSDCCYEPTVRRMVGSPEMHYRCTKCEKRCELLTEDQKIEINKRAKGAIDGLLVRMVRVIVIHKPSNQSTSKRVGISEVRKFAEEAIRQFRGMGIDAKDSDFVVVEVEQIKEGERVQVSSLEKLGA